MKKHRFLFSVCASLLIIVFLYLVNIITSPGYLWFVYPAFVTVWWPLSVLLAKRDTIKLYSVVMGVLTIGFFALINVMHYAGYLWFVYPAFAVLWWPLSMLLAKRGTIKLYSVVMSVLTIGFLVLINVMHYAGYIWFYYPVFAVLWWPLSMLLAKRGTFKLYSVVMSVLTIGFLALINIMNTPQTVWFHYAIFYVAWWPVVMCLGKRAASVSFAVIGAVLILGYHTLLYYALTPGIYPWHLSLIPPAVLWPMGIALGKRVKNAGFIVLAIAILLYYIILNLILPYDWVLTRLLRLH